VPKDVGFCVGSVVAFILWKFPLNSPSRRHSQGGFQAILGPKRPTLGQTSTFQNSPESEDFKTVLNFVREPVFAELCLFKARGILGLKTTIV